MKNQPCTQGRGSLDALPVEIVIKIVSFLNPLSILAVRLTCWNLKVISESQEVWESKLNLFLPHLSKVLEEFKAFPSYIALSQRKSYLMDFNLQQYHAIGMPSTSTSSWEREDKKNLDVKYAHQMHTHIVPTCKELQWPPCYIDMRRDLIAIRSGEGISGKFKIINVSIGSSFTACLVQSCQLLLRERRIICWSGTSQGHYDQVIRVLKGFQRPHFDSSMVALPSLSLQDNDIIVKVTSGREFVLALTSMGKIYICRPNDYKIANDAKMFQYLQRKVYTWQEIAIFSQPLYNTGYESNGSNFWDFSPYAKLVTPSSKITHIATSQDQIVAYNPDAGEEIGMATDSRGIVIIVSINSLDQPRVYRQLQGTQVYKFNFYNDHQNAPFWLALTRGGQLLFWREYHLITSETIIDS